MVDDGATNGNARARDASWSFEEYVHQILSELTDKHFAPSVGLTQPKSIAKPSMEAPQYLRHSNRMRVGTDMKVMLPTMEPIPWETAAN